MDKVVLSNALKNMEKNLISNTKKLETLKDLTATIKQDTKTIESLKEEILKIKATESQIEDCVSKTKVLELANKFNNSFFETYDILTKETFKSVKDSLEFFEKYRTHRTYFLTENKIERFLSEFLSSFAEDFIFKPEFAGVLDLNRLANLTGGQKENSAIKIKYDNIPRIIKEAYNLNQKKFIIESHSLKLLFKKNYIIDVVANNNMIKKIDKVAKDCEINFE